MVLSGGLVLPLAITVTNWQRYFLTTENGGQRHDFFLPVEKSLNKIFFRAD